MVNLFPMEIPRVLNLFPRELIEGAPGFFNLGLAEDVAEGFA